MVRPLNGKFALVTGSSRGIGRAAALRLARDGAKVMVHCRSRRDEAEAVAQAIRNEGGEARVALGDVAELADIERIFAEMDAWRGSAPLDILVANAAVHGIAGALETATPEAVDRTLATNLRGPFLMAQAAAARMTEGGRIIFVGAVAARHGYAFDPIYAATKGGLASLTPALAAHLGARGITVNTVVPGVTDTEMIDAHRSNQPVMDWMIGETALGRIGSAEDVADVIGVVAGPDGRWITGQSVDATGGLWI